MVLGWGLWPVTWKNALPPDLRSAERQEYLLMTAESFAQSGDLAVARARLESWPEDELVTYLGELQDRLATANPLQASQVQLLTGALGVGQEPAVEAPVATTPEGSTQVSNLLRTACITALWVLLVLGGILAILYLVRRWRNADQTPTLEVIEEAPVPTASLHRSGTQPFPQVETDYATTPSTQAPPWDAGATTDSPDYVSDEGLPDEEFAPLSEADSRVAPATAAQAGVAREQPRPAVPTAVVAAGVVREAKTSVAGMSRAGDYRAIYQMGESDYDEAFDINDAAGAYIGQCGVELVDPVGHAHDQAAAVQVWLWDTNDHDTKVKVLMSEGAFRDSALRDQLAGEHSVLPVQAGSEFELTSYNLVLKGVVERIEYAEQEPLGGIFSELQVRLSVYQKSH